METNETQIYFAKLCQNIIAIKKTLNDLRKRCHDFEARYNAAKDICDNLDTKNAKLTGDVDDLNNRLIHQQQEYAVLQEDHEALKSEYESLRVKYNKKEAKCEELRKYASDLEQKYSGVLVGQAEYEAQSDQKSGLKRKQRNESSNTPPKSFMYGDLVWAKTTTADTYAQNYAAAIFIDYESITGGYVVFEIATNKITLVNECYHIHKRVYNTQCD